MERGNGDDVFVAKRDGVPGSMEKGRSTLEAEVLLYSGCRYDRQIQLRFETIFETVGPFR